jgi:hypothetical protein
VKKQIGSYADHQFAIENPEKTKPEIFARAKLLGTLSIQLQWVKGDATKAEESFFKINQQASPIDKTELRLLKARRLPNALAAEVRKLEIEQLAKALNDLLFSPALKTPIKSVDLPVAGRGYSSQTLPLVFEFVNLVNPMKPDVKPKPDETGEETIRVLKNCRSIMNRISGTHPSSLGLHPAVYFYSSAGRYQPTAFMAVIVFIQELERKNGFRDFIKVRRPFEDFLLKHRKLVNQVTVKYGSGPKGFARLHQLLSWLVDQFLRGGDEAGIIAEIPKKLEFSFLQPAEQDEPGEAADFSSEAKSAVFLRDALKDPLRCGICQGLIHSNAISIDHVVRRSEGGKGITDNGQLTHPYCNTTIKN